MVHQPHHENRKLLAMENKTEKRQKMGYVKDKGYKCVQVNSLKIPKILEVACLGLCGWWSLELLGIHLD